MDPIASAIPAAERKLLLEAQLKAARNTSWIQGKNAYAYKQAGLEALAKEAAETSAKFAAVVEILEKDLAEVNQEIQAALNNPPPAAR